MALVTERPVDSRSSVRQGELQTAWGRRMRTLATGLLVLLSALVAESSSAQQSINAAPDAIFYNGKIITVDSGFAIEQAFAVRGELYVAVGTNAAIQALAGENTRLVDLRGSAVIPGLSDNHDHLYNSEKVMRGIDLVGATSTAEVLSRLRGGLAKAKEGETVFGGVGWRAPLAKNDLDQISTEVPIVALRGRRGGGRDEQCRPEEGGDYQGNASLYGKADPERQQWGTDWGAA
jgi:imidazolonepropionase-like amidohydrolase